MGMFLSVDTVPGNQQGMNPYQYVEDNPETHNDPSGHCWPLCTMLIGAVIGATISVGTTVVTNAVQGKPTYMGQIAQATVVGALSGAVAGLADPLAKIAVGVLSSGAGQMVSNAMSGRSASFRSWVKCGSVFSSTALAKNGLPALPHQNRTLGC